MLRTTRWKGSITLLNDAENMASQDSLIEVNILKGKRSQNCCPSSNQWSNHKLVVVSSPIQEINFPLHQSLLRRIFFHDQEDTEGGLTCQKDLPLNRTLWTHPNKTDDLSERSLQTCLRICSFSSLNPLKSQVILFQGITNRSPFDLSPQVEERTFFSKKDIQNTLNSFNKKAKKNTHGGPINIKF